MSETTISIYYRVRLKNLTPEQEDILTSHAFETGASGVSEALSFTQPDLTYEPKILNSKTHEIDVYFEVPPTEDFFSGVKDLSSQISWQIFEEPKKDWLEEWKKGFKAFKLVDSFWVVPSWEPVPKECKNPLLIDPGMAFGTGTHATTQMAAFFVNKFGKENSNLAGLNLMDVGTGTGILAMMAKKLGVGSVTGIEIDPEARRVAKENIIRNNLESIVISDQLLEEVSESHDVVIANIVDGVLIHFKNELLKITKPNGYLFLTGILTEREDHFINEFIEKTPTKIILRLEKDDWVGFWVQKIDKES